MKPPAKHVPEAPPIGPEDYAAGTDEHHAGRLRGPHDMAAWGATARRERKARDFAQAPARRKRIDGERGSLPVNGDAPKPPPVTVFYQLLDEIAETEAEIDGRRDFGAEPAAVYGQYPRAFIARILPWLNCARHEILHVCSGSLPRGEGIRVDIRPEAQPDILADGRALPLPDGSQAAVLIDPPYSPHYAAKLYGIEYPRPSHLLVEATRVVRPGGRVCIVHYITPKPPPRCRFVKAFGLSTGFDMPIRAVSIYEREQATLF